MGAPTIRNSAKSASMTDPGTAVIPQPVSGNFIVVFAVGSGSFAAINAHDSASNTYTRQSAQVDDSGNYIVCYTAPVTATGSGNLTVSVEITSCVIAMELTGNVSSTPIDGSVTTGNYNSAGPGTITATGIVTTVATDLILSGVVDQNQAAITVNTGTSVQSSTLYDTFIVQQHTTSATGTFAEAFNVPSSSGETARMIAIAIKGTAAGGISIPAVMYNYRQRRM